MAVMDTEDEHIFIVRTLTKTGFGDSLKGAADDTEDHHLGKAVGTALGHQEDTPEGDLPLSIARAGTRASRLTFTPRYLLMGNYASQSRSCNRKRHLPWP